MDEETARTAAAGIPGAVQALEFLEQQGGRAEGSLLRDALGTEAEKR